MTHNFTTERLIETLIDGDRSEARSIVGQQLAAGLSPEELLCDLFWPAYETVDRLFRGDQISTLGHNLATRLLRTLVDQNSAKLLEAEIDDAGQGRSVLGFCGPSESEELGAQMAVDLLEARGFGVRFAGAGVANDEIISRIHEHRPEVVVMFCSAPADLPGIRELIDTVRDMGVCKDTQIVVGGGVFNRAEGLAEEIGADLWAADPLDLVETMIAAPEHRADEEQRTVGRTRRVRRAA